MSVNVYRVRAAGPRGPGLSGADTATLDAAVDAAEAAQGAAESAASDAAASAVEFGTFRDNVLSIPTDHDVGVPVPVNGDATLAAGSWVFVDEMEQSKTLTEFEIWVSNTAGTVTITRLSESGGVYTEEAATAALALVAGQNLFDVSDFGEFTFPDAGEFLGFWISSDNACRRLVGDTSGVTTMGFGGAGHLSSFTPTLNAGFNQMQIRAKLVGPEDTVTAERLLAVEEAVGINGGSTDLLVFGDSLTTDALGFVDELAALLPDRTVTGQGVGGQQAGSIAVRTGGIEADATVSGASIPASGGGVTITAITPDPFAASIGDPASYIASLHDVPGVLSRSAAVYTFTRSDAGGAIALTNPAKLRIRSTYAANTTGEGTTLLAAYDGRVGVLRNGHNDVFNDVIRDSAAYSRQAVKDYIAAQVEALGGVNRAIVCSITRGYSWLTAARISALGLSGTITGWAADDAETIAAVIECQALNQWMADTFPGYVDLVAAYEAASASYISSIDLGSSHVYDFANETILPDGTHGADGGPEQTVAAQAVADKIDELGL